MIEEVGTVQAVRPVAGGRSVAVRAPEIAAEARAGDSISVNGICLTVEDIAAPELHFHVGAESFARTTAANWQPGRLVNLERAMRAGDRLGGHFVQGHVDCIGRLANRVAEGQTQRFTFTMPREMLRYVVPRGSIAVDGISLTVTGIGEDSFSVAVIPYTLRHTNLQALAVGEAVNIEVDILAKYVERMLTYTAATGGELTEQFLAEHGFM